MALSQGFCSKYTILNSDAIGGTKVSGYYREGGHSSDVAINCIHKHILWESVLASIDCTSTTKTHVLNPL